MHSSCPLPDVPVEAELQLAVTPAPASTSVSLAPNPIFHPPTPSCSLIQLDTLLRANPRRERRHRGVAVAVRNFICRIDVCGVFLYFLFVAIVAAISMVCTTKPIESSILESQLLLHNNRVAIANIMIDQATQRTQDMAVGFIAIRVQSHLKMQSENTLATLCSLLLRYDIRFSFLSFSVTSFGQQELVSCLRDASIHDARAAINAKLVGAISYNHSLKELYDVNPATLKLQHPLQVAYRAPARFHNVSELLRTNYATMPLLASAVAYYDHEITSLDPALFWSVAPNQPQVLLYRLPFGYVYRGLSLPKNTNPADYVQVRIDGSTIASILNPLLLPGLFVTVLIYESLADPDPFILSDSWGQPSMSFGANSTLAEVLVPHRYLKVSEVDHPVVRAALRRLPLARLQEKGYQETLHFRYKHTPVMATAVTFLSSNGLFLPMVYVTVQEDVSGAYLRDFDKISGVLWGTVVFVVIIFWVLVQLHFSRPLRRMAALLDSSLKQEDSTLPSGGWLRGFGGLAEVRALGQTVNAAVDQLQEIYAFLPTAACGELQRRGLLDRASSFSEDSTLSLPPVEPSAATERVVTGLAHHLSTVVYITIQRQQQRQRQQTGSPSSPTTGQHPSWTSPLRARSARPCLAAAVALTAQEIRASNEGSFSSPADLSAFVASVHDLANIHHGTILRLCPDTCILHFHAAVRSHLLPAAQPRQQQRELSFASAVSEETELHAQQDAQDAAAFVLALLAWIKTYERASARLPRICFFLNTGFFTCGAYCPTGGEQTLTVALGRDLQRDVGQIVQRIGVQAATTEETATRLRPSRVSCSDPTSAVRLLPVEVLQLPAGNDSEEVVLYELLPGPLVGDVAWERYARYYTDGFTCMVRGAYADALDKFRQIEGTLHLERGLLPRGTPHEKDVSGSVSVQMSRLMGECVRRLRVGATAGYRRVPQRSPGVRASPSLPLPRSETVRRKAEEAVVTAAADVFTATSSSTSSLGDARASPEETANQWLRRGRHQQPCQLGPSLYPMVRERNIEVVAGGPGGDFRFVRPTQPAWIRDNHKMLWYLAYGTSATKTTQQQQQQQQQQCKSNQLHSGLNLRYGVEPPPYILALGSAGAIASTNFLAYRQVHPLVKRVIDDAPLGPMSEALRSAVPVMGPSAQQANTNRLFFNMHTCVSHRNLLRPFAYSESLEGGVVPLWELCAGGSLRQLLARYQRVRFSTLVRFGLDILTGLRFLHRRGWVHGDLHLDNVLVDGYGRCLLIGQSANRRMSQHVYAEPPSCYESPAMAAGALPTPSCDMYCYGLMILEAVTGERCWRWTEAASHPLAHSPTSAPLADTEIESFMVAGGQAFRDAVLQRLVEVKVDLLDTPPVRQRYPAHLIEMCRRLLSSDPAERPTVAEMREETKAALEMTGFTVDDEDE